MNLNVTLKQLVRPVVTAMIAVVIIAASHTTSEARNHTPKDDRQSDSFRKSNKNYSNACVLLYKKRTAKIKTGRKSKKVSKWR